MLSTISKHRQFNRRHFFPNDNSVDDISKLYKMVVHATGMGIIIENSYQEGFEEDNPVFHFATKQQMEEEAKQMIQQAGNDRKAYTIKSDKYLYWITSPNENGERFSTKIFGFSPDEVHELNQEMKQTEHHSLRRNRLF